MLFGLLMPDSTTAKPYNYRGESDLQHLLYNNGNSLPLFPIRLRGDLPGRAARSTMEHIVSATLTLLSAQGCRIERRPQMQIDAFLLLGC